jgi:DNA-binding LacI/PurR family transcriptional regulator
MKDVTIRDVAVAAGVSFATVSRVLNQHPNVSPKFRGQVLAAVRRLGYSLDDLPRHKTIAIIFNRNDFKGYFFGIADALIQVISAKGYLMELIPEQNMELINDRLVDGVISLEYSNQLNHYWNKHKCNPLVCINEYSVHLDNIYSVCSNERQGLAMAVACLVRHGHRRIGLVTLGDNNYCNDLREKSFLSEAAAAGLDTTPCYRTSFENLPAVVNQVRQTKLTAIIGSGEDTGIQLAGCLNENGYAIPRDISLISWESDGISPHLVPPQTTIGQDFYAIAGKALGMLEKLMRREHQVKDCLVDYLLYERASVNVPPF